MKKQKIIRLRLLVVLWPGKRRRGVAIITVLAIVSLMTVLIVSFFQMAQTAKTTAVGTVEMERVVTLKDVITNYVTAQIRQATTLRDNSGMGALWTSQPGAIRTYHATPDLSRVYKLYSAERMLIESVSMETSGRLLNDIENDLDPRWDEYPDSFVDLNRPVRPSSSERKAQNPREVQERLIYPIADPSRYNGQENDPRNTEGFVYGERRLSSMQLNGVDPRKSQLAMPVRWIYLLRDGTTGVVDKDGKFRATEKSGGEASKDNPIVSRLAWWVDDESCKINVNTASIPVPWDTPRTSSKEDVYYAQFQPISGEVQHYPGHPAQTDLCAVFFPGQRYSPDTSIIPLGKMQKLDKNQADLVWSITPFVTEKGGTQGGTVKVSPLSATPVPLDFDDHMLATFEELYFKARNASTDLDAKRGSVERDDSNRQLLSRIEASQFFLTTRSNSPEITVYGTPRVCMFPMNDKVVAEVGKASGAVVPTVGTFEVTMATNATIGAKLGVLGKAFYFQRSTNSDSRHNAFYNNNGGRNVQILKYLKKLSVSIPPGYPELSNSKYRSFAQKYGKPANDAGDNTTFRDFDSSDRTQILMSMLDMLRSSNMSPGYLSSGNSYDGGLGQVSGICGCQPRNSDPQGPHTTALAIPQLTNQQGKQPWITPKGSGRTYGPAEISFFAIVPAYKKGTQIIGTAPQILNGNMNTRWQQSKNASLIQVGVLVNAFTPRQGWAPMFGQGGINLSNHRAASSSDPRSPVAGDVLAPFVLANNNGDAETSFYMGGAPHPGSTIPCTNGLGKNPAVGNVPPGLIPWGGLAGPRVMSTQYIATIDPFVYEGDGAGSPNPINVQLKWKPHEILRIFLYEGSVNAANTNQAIDVCLDIHELRLVADHYPAGTAGLVQAANTPNFPPPEVTFTSLVVSHGDYRLTATPLRVVRGIFLPHANASHALVEPILNGNASSYVPVGSANVGNTVKQALLADKKLPVMQKPWLPHFPPVVDNTLLCSDRLGTNPSPAVLRVASSTGDVLRKRRFANGRRDGQYSVPVFNPWDPKDQYNPTFPNGQNSLPNRGSSDPLETGDFDNGVGLCPDGAYMNQPDDGDVRDQNMPYYLRLTQGAVARPATFSPNRVLRSPVDFGSIPSGVQAQVPWQTLRFRPDPGMYEGENRIEQPSSTPQMPDGYQHFFPFANYCGPKDHLFLDMWWVPVVEPWSISEGFATKGQINLNQQIFPFTYIQRTTGLHALLRSERMMAIPDSAYDEYKNPGQLGNADTYRHWINAKETVRQITDFRWKGLDPEGFTMPFNAFRSASEVCELWLVPEKNGVGDEAGPEWTLDYMIREFWKTHRLTGDNMRERPYSNLYPRLTVRSNVYRVHMIAQTLKQADSNKPDTFNSAPDNGNDADLVTAEWRGSALVERVLNPNEPVLQQTDYAPRLDEPVLDSATPVWPKTLDNFYTYRVTEVKRFTE